MFEQLGDRDAALHWLGVALRSGYPRADVDSDPTFEKLQTDPRWKKLAQAETAPPKEERVMESKSRVATKRRVTIGKHRFGFRVKPGSLRIDPVFGETPTSRSATARR